MTEITEIQIGEDKRRIRDDKAIYSEELNTTLKDYAKKAEIPDVSDLATKQEVATATNDMLTKTEAAQTYQSKGNYATAEQLATKADKTAIPTKVSQLTNDSNYLTAVPDEYVTETELQGKGYATTTQVGQAVADKLTKTQADGYYQSKGDYALKSEIPDTSQLATKTELGKKLDAATYNSEKVNFATKAEIGDIETILDNIIGG